MHNSSMALEERYGASNYHPLPVTLVRGQGFHLWDDQGRCYIDCMSAYSAVSHGHAHPKLVRVLCDQAQRLSVVSRAYHTDRLGPFLEAACTRFGFERALPMNTGAEAVETALKAARKWGYSIKGVPADRAEIIVCQNNFHGRTIAIVGMSSEAQYREGFGPFPAGFKVIPYDDIQALEEAITPHTVAFLMEPIQGEAGIIVPQEGYLRAVRECCDRHQVLWIADEIQCGMGRTGKLKACDHEDVSPDALILGKALGGGLLPVSLFLSSQAVMSVFRPGDHGSTFGGNPLAAAVALEAIRLLDEEELIERARTLGSHFKEGLLRIHHPAIRAVRGKGLLLGMELDPSIVAARAVCLQLMNEGVLSKDTHQTVIRFAPPLMIDQEAIDRVLVALEKVLFAA